MAGGGRKEKRYSLDRVGGGGKIFYFSLRREKRESVCVLRERVGGEEKTEKGHGGD